MSNEISLTFEDDYMELINELDIDIKQLVIDEINDKKEEQNKITGIPSSVLDNIKKMYEDCMSNNKDTYSFYECCPHLGLHFAGFKYRCCCVISIIIPNVKDLPEDTTLNSKLSDSGSLLNDINMKIQDQFGVSEYEINHIGRYNSSKDSAIYKLELNNNDD